MSGTTGPKGKRIRHIPVFEVGVPGKGRIAGGFISIFKDEIMRSSLFQEKARKKKLKPTKKRRKQRAT